MDGPQLAAELAVRYPYIPVLFISGIRVRGTDLPAPLLPKPSDPDLVSTSYVERSNLSLRMQQRRFTRLTNAFSKKAENHAHAVSLYFMYYNFCRPHQTLTKRHRNHYPTTPAMASGLTNRVWKVEDIVAAMEPETLLPA